MRKVPLLAERRAVDLDVLQVPGRSTAGVVVTDPAVNIHVAIDVPRPTGSAYDQQVR